MPTGRRLWAYVVAAFGSAGVLGSLWLPWYSFRIPGAAIDQAVQLSQQFGTLAPVIRQGAEIARNLGALQLTAWQVLQQADIFIAIAAAAAGGLALLASAGRARGAARIVVSAAAVGLVVAAYRTVSPPGPDGLLHPAWGAWLAVICGAVAVAGGLIAGGDEARADSTPAAGPLGWAPAEFAAEQPTSWASAGSVAPPGS